MAVTFNGPLKISRPGYTVDGVTPGNTSVPNRQAWFAPVPVTVVLTVNNNNVSAVVPAGAALVSARLLADSTSTSTAASGMRVNGVLVAETPALVAGGNVADYLPRSAAEFAPAVLANFGNVGANDVTVLFDTLTNVDGFVYLTYIPRNTDGSLSDEGYRPFAQ